MSKEEELLKAKNLFGYMDVYRNNKNGNLYYVHGVAMHSETMEVTVVYVDKAMQMWNRPWELFLEKFTLVNQVSKSKGNGVL